LGVVIGCAGFGESWNSAPGLRVVIPDPRLDAVAGENLDWWPDLSR
jgi:hypothetical protein